MYLEAKIPMTLGFNFTSLDLTNYDIINTSISPHPSDGWAN